MLKDKTPCAHPSTTLIQHVHHDGGSAADAYGEEEPGLGEVWFAAYQCDECGAITRKEVTGEDLAGANNAPWLDLDAYQARTQERMVGEVEVTAMRFMLRATRG